MKNSRILIAVLTVALLVIAACSIFAACDGNTVTVTFTGDGIETFKQEVKKGKPVAEPTPPERGGYTFKCWKDGDGKDWDFDTPVQQNMTLTAVWSANESKITLNPNGGNLNGGGTEYTVKTDETPTLPIPTFLNQLTFRGWALDGTLLTGSDGKFLAKWDGDVDVTLNAVWTTKGDKNLFEVTTKTDGTFAIAAWDTKFDDDLTFPTKIGDKTVSEIGDMSKLTSSKVTVPAGITLIGQNSFQYNTDIRIADLSAFDGVIGENAFYSSNLSIVELGSTSAISANAFANSNIQLIYIPESVRSIGNGALASSSLVEIDFEGDFPTLGQDVFGEGNSDLSMIASQSAWDKLTENATGENFEQKVQNATDLSKGSLFTWSDETVESAKAAHGFYTGDITAYLGLGLNIAVYTDGNVNLADIYDGKTEGDHFYDFGSEPRKTYLLDKGDKTSETLKANSKGEVIKDGVLYDYFGSDIVYRTPSEVTAIAGGAGMDNTSVRFVITGDNVTTIGSFAFAYGNLFGITIGEHVTAIGDYAFFYNSYLAQLIFEGTTAPTIGQGAFCDLLNGIAIVPMTLNTLATYGISVKIYTVNDVISWGDPDEGYPFYEALVKSLEGLDLGTIKDSSDGEEKPVSYSTSDFSTLQTSYFAAKGATYQCDLGTITMSGATNGYAYITLKDNKGESYIYFSAVPGYNLSYYDSTTAPLKIQVFTQLADGEAQSVILYGKLGDGKLTLRGLEAGTYGEIDSDYFVIDGYGNITYRKQDGTLLEGTYTVEGDNTLKLEDIDGIESLTIDTENHTVTFHDSQLSALGEEAGVYYDIVNRAILKLDGKATENASGMMELTFNGTTVTMLYNINGKKLTFVLNGENKEWTFDKTSDEICTGYYGNYEHYLKFSKVSIGLKGTFTETSGSGTLILDGYFTATLNGKECVYYAFGSSILLFDGDNVTIYNLDEENYKFALPTAAEAGIYYTTTSQNYRVYLDGKGNLAYFTGDDYDIGTYTLNADKLFDVVLNGQETTQKGFLDTEKGYGTMVYYSYGDSFMGISKKPIETLLSYAYVKVYFVESDKITTSSPSINVYLSGDVLFVSTYGAPFATYLLNTQQQTQNFDFAYKYNDKTATIDVKVKKSDDAYTVSLSFKGVQEIKEFNANVDGEEKEIVFCWLDEEKTKAGIYYLSYGYPTDIIYGTVDGSVESGTFTVTDSDGNSYTVIGYNTDKVTLTKVEPSA